jgi:hypothetical protein
MPAQLHFAKDPLPLHLLLERLQRLVDVVVTNENLHLAACSFPLSGPAHREPAKSRSRAVARARGCAYNT